MTTVGQLLNRPAKPQPELVEVAGGDRAVAIVVEGEEVAAEVLAEEDEIARAGSYKALARDCFAPRAFAWFLHIRAAVPRRVRDLLAL